MITSALQIVRKKMMMNKQNLFKMLRGGLDFRGYEVVRGQFFSIAATRSVTIAPKGIRFSPECIRNLGCAEYAEVLVHPTKKTLAVRTCAQENRRAMRWATFKDSLPHSRGISGAAFIGTLYELFGLASDCRYRFRGSIKKIGTDKIIEFDMTEPETIIPGGVLFPSDWDKDFGEDYYYFMDSLFSSDDNGFVTQSFYNTEPDIRPTVPEILSAEIESLINTLRKQEAAEHGAKPRHDL